jgi:NTP pyrophosphatase (non-canonical NTP hydrolase)
MALTFKQFREINVERAKTFPSAKQNWTPADWMVALMGEVGELAAVIPNVAIVADDAEMMKRVIAALGAVTNTMKKLRRGIDYTKGKSEETLRRDLFVQFAGFLWWSNRMAEALFDGSVPVPSLLPVLEEGDSGAEVADVQTYLDLLANSLAVPPTAALVKKFNEVSKRVGSPLMLEE